MQVSSYWKWKPFSFHCLVGNTIGINTYKQETPVKSFLSEIACVFFTQNNIKTNMYSKAILKNADGNKALLLKSYFTLSVFPALLSSLTRIILRNNYFSTRSIPSLYVIIYMYQWTLSPVISLGLDLQTVISELIYTPSHSAYST